MPNALLYILTSRRYLAEQHPLSVKHRSKLIIDPDTLLFAFLNGPN